MSVIVKGGGGGKSSGLYVWKKSYGILPSEYKVVEYIEGTGTQYIDTGFKPNNNTCYEIKYQTVPTQNYAGIMGAEHGWGDTTLALWCKHAGFANSTITNQTWYGASPVTIRFDKGTLYKDGVQVWSASGTFQCNYNAYLFGINRAGTLTEPLDNLKIYYVKIWDNGTLVRDFVPCTKNGIAGLYDRVNNDFYVNKGSGTFSVGEVISEATNIEYVVSDEPNKYPNGGEQGGYWYERGLGIDLSALGCTKAVTEKITPSSRTSKIYHSLGITPKIVIVTTESTAVGRYDTQGFIVAPFSLKTSAKELLLGGTYNNYSGSGDISNHSVSSLTSEYIDIGEYFTAGVEYIVTTIG